MSLENGAHRVAIVALAVWLAVVAVFSTRFGGGVVAETLWRTAAILTAAASATVAVASPNTRRDVLLSVAVGGVAGYRVLMTGFRLGEALITDCEPIGPIMTALATWVGFSIAYVALVVGRRK